MEAASKETIIEELRAMAKSEPFEPDFISKANDLRHQFEELQEKGIEEQKEKYLADGGEEMYFEPKKDELDARFNEAWNLFTEAKTAFKTKKANEEKRNLDEKKALLKELNELTNEENIGRAFQRFRLIQDKWNEVGVVPKSQYKELQEEYSKLIDQFYYQIRIFKELQHHDLKKHYDQKKELIEKMRELASHTKIKEIELYVKAYEADWNRIGPTFQDKWEEVRDEFREVTHKVYEKINEHYHELREKQKENLEQKRALIEKASQLLAEKLPNSPKNWEELTDKAKALMDEWKKTGRGPKAKSDAVWEEFRGKLDEIYEAKKQFYKARRDNQNEHKHKKQALIEEAEALQESEMWKQTTKKLIDLQKQWKEVGPASPKDEQKLWQKFRAACDHFFERKKQYFENIDSIHEENLKQKQAILDQLKAFKLGDNKTENIEQLKSFAHNWNQIGHVPRDKKESLQNEFQAQLDEHYNKLNIQKKEKLKIQFETKLDKLQDSENSAVLLKKENRAISEELKRLESEVLNYENNMAFFKHAKDDNPLKLQAEKKIKQLKERIETLKMKKKMLKQNA